MTNLPIRGEADSLDNLSVTREEFRVGIGRLLEYLAQALGGINTTYEDQDVDPTAVVLQGEPVLDIDAVPDPGDDSLRIACTSWVLDQLGGTTGDFVPRTGGVMTGDLRVPSLNGGSLAGLRNLLTNGDFRIDQRAQGGAFALTAGGPFIYGCDRWFHFCSGANVTAQRVSLAGTQTDPTRMQFIGGAGVVGIGLGQRIEAVNCRHLAGQEAAFSVNMSNSLLTTVSWEASYANTTDAFGGRAAPSKTMFASGTFTVGSSYARHSAVLEIPAEATTGIEIVLSVGAQTSGTWVVGQAQLEQGPQATPFERRPIALEESLCQRYFMLGRSSATLNVNTTTANVSFATFYPQPMRVTPTIVGWGPSFNSRYGWVGFQNTLGLSWAGDVAYTADAEL